MNKMALRALGHAAHVMRDEDAREGRRAAAVQQRRAEDTPAGCRRRRQTPARARAVTDKPESTMLYDTLKSLLHNLMQNKTAWWQPYMYAIRHGRADTLSALSSNFIWPPLDSGVGLYSWYEPLSLSSISAIQPSSFALIQLSSHRILRKHVISALNLCPWQTFHFTRSTTGSCAREITLPALGKHKKAEHRVARLSRVRGHDTGSAQYPCCTSRPGVINVAKRQRQLAAHETRRGRRRLEVDLEAVWGAGKQSGEQGRRQVRIKSKSRREGCGWKGHLLILARRRRSSTHDCSWRAANATSVISRERLLLQASMLTMGRAEGSWPQTAHRWRLLDAARGSSRCACPRTVETASKIQEEMGTVTRTN
jgi:hypothetical protein